MLRSFLIKVFGLSSACCLRPFSECFGCVFPAYVSAVAPSGSLPQELGLVGTALDTWKVHFEVGMAKRQSFAFVLDGFRCQNCWKATVGDETILVVFVGTTTRASVKCDRRSSCGRLGKHKSLPC